MEQNLSKLGVGDIGPGGSLSCRV